MRRTAMLAISVTITVPAAIASPEADALARSGLIGTWAPNCESPASESNPHTTWEATPQGFVALWPNRGKGKHDQQFAASGFRILSAGRVGYAASDDGGETDIMLLVEPRQYRIWSSDARGAAATNTNDAYVKDGKYFFDGSDTEWYHRCTK